MWLGEQDQYTASAFASLLQTGELIRKGHMEALAYPLDLKAIAAALLAGSELTQRLYFTRMRIIQDILLARSVGTFCFPYEEHCRDPGSQRYLPVY